jgi:hypothetical protein
MTQTPRIELVFDDTTEQWSATDVETGVSSCGETREEALAMLDDALSLQDTEPCSRGEAQEILSEMDIDPSVLDEPAEELPSFMQGGS